MGNKTSQDDGDALARRVSHRSWKVELVDNDNDNLPKYEMEARASTLLTVRNKSVNYYQAKERGL